MQKSVCNIVWVDDEIDTLLTDSKKRILKKEGFELIGVARTYMEFTQIMEMCYDRVDAVITDANFHSTSSPNSEKDISGLMKISATIHSYNNKRDIPFYLFTGRREVLLEKCEDGELDYFEINNRYFTKGNFEELLTQIRGDVEHINSASYQVRKKYKKELDAAKLIEGNEERLRAALLCDYSEDWNNINDNFNPLRKIVEAIFDNLKRLNVIPNIAELNAISRFLGKGEHEKYSLNDDRVSIMPKPLARGLWYFLEITQDASHNREASTLGVEKYVRDTQNVNLFRSALFIAMDLCLWFMKCKEEAELPGYTPLWREKQTETVEQNENFESPITESEYEGIVTRGIQYLVQDIYYSGNFLLERPKDNNYKEGDLIRIKLSSENKKSQITLLNNEKIVLGRYARISNIKVVKPGSKDYT